MLLQTEWLLPSEPLWDTGTELVGLQSKWGNAQKETHQLLRFAHIPILVIFSQNYKKSFL